MGKKVYSLITFAAATAAFVVCSGPLRAEDRTDPFGAWQSLPQNELQRLQGGTEGDNNVIDSHNAVLANDNDLSNENLNNSISNSGGTMSTGTTQAVVDGNRGFTGVISNTGNQNNFLQNWTVNIYLK